MSNEVKCPKCGSNQITAQKKGFSAGKAAAGAILTGGVGLLAGFHGSSDIDVSCLACGHHWNPKKLSEEVNREELSKKLSEYKAWRNTFYDAYHNEKYDEAAIVYESRFKFFPAIPDVHAAYKDLKKKDSQNQIAQVVIFSILAVVIFLLIKWVA
jgi:ribosomal protein S27E